jgi:hypothetical protein
MYSMRHRSRGASWIHIVSLLAVLTLGVAETNAACLARSPGGDERQPRVLVVIVPAADVGAFKAKGYVDTSCPTETGRMSAIVQSMCADRSSDRVPANVSLWIYGFTRERLCSAARAGLVEVGG